MVKVNNQVPLGNVGRPTGRPATRKSEGKGAEGVPSEGDKVKLSGNGEAMSIAKAAASNVNDVDEAKVAELRNALARGEYRADLRIVAERVISEALQTGIPRG
ncbi:flagellar biosynthesis anti-sigma factor FlgM [Myxococcota bacterium]|jgi:flagellar biosynthesis anti-sigma factor FlgM|nr:flagellar biosynthesis anti-sigma factor FlgM [Myxococcota bacterium]